MTFPAELEMLLKTQPDAQLLLVRRNHADAILGLVRAAEYVMEDEPSGIPRADSRTRKVVAEALAKLNGDGK